MKKLITVIYGLYLLAAAPVFPQENAMEHYNRGNMHMGDYDYELAIEEYTETIRIAPHYYRAYFRRGNAYFADQDFEKAMADYSFAIGIKPDYTEAYFQRAIVHFHNGDFDKAIKDWELVLKIEPHRVSASRNIELARRLQEE